MAFARMAALACLGALVGCDDVSIRPEPTLPKPLIVPLNTDVGLIIAADTRHVEKETRYGVDWKIDLGPGEARLMREVFQDLFRRVVEFPDLRAARAGHDLTAVFEPRMEQYSFVTSRETGGRYYAVTIRYRINLYTAQGEKLDTYTLTGYGNALAGSMSPDGPLTRATLAAMRDAAAKFLVQFPDQAAARLLAKNEALVAEPVPTAAAAQIEAVPIE
jgi:hypothetical protein